MEEKKKFEALQYSYENAGQFRAIAAILGYSEEYRNGDITFSKGNETYTYPLNTLKLGNLGDNRESLLEQSKERIISFFDKVHRIREKYGTWKTRTCDRHLHSGIVLLYSFRYPHRMGESVERSDQCGNDLWNDQFRSRYRMVYFHEAYQCGYRRCFCGTSGDHCDRNCSRIRSFPHHRKNNT